MFNIQFTNRWKYFLLTAIGILFLAFLLRIINLTLLPVFADEAIYIRWSQVMATEPTLRFLPLSDGKQPLFMWILMFVVSRINDPLFAGRLISVMSGLGTLVGTGVLSFVLFKSKKASCVAMLLWAISPFALFFDRMALVDSLLAFFAIWVAIFTLLTAKTNRLDFAMITGFFLGGGLLTKSPALFFVILMPISFLFIKFGKNRAYSLLKLASLFLVTLVIGYGMYNILRLGPNFHLIASRNLDYVHPITHLFERPLDPLLPFLDRVKEWIWILGPASLYLLTILSTFLSIKKFPKQIIFLLAWVAVPIVINAEFAKVFTARYIFYTIPFLIILAASGFARVKIPKILLAALVIFVIQSFWQNYFLITNPAKAYMPQSEKSGYLSEWSAGQGIKEISLYLKNLHNQDPNQQIVVGTEGYFGTLPDGLQIYMQGVENVIVVGVGVNIENLPTPLVESKAAGNRTFLVINKSRLIGDPDQMGLQLISQYPKELRLEATHEYVRYGPQEVLYFFEVK